MTEGREQESELRPAAAETSRAESFGDLVALGELAVRSGEHQSAVDYYFRALERAADGSEKASTLRRLAYALNRMGRLEEALDFALRAAEEARRAEDVYEAARAEQVDAEIQRLRSARKVF